MISALPRTPLRTSALAQPQAAVRSGSAGAILASQAPAATAAPAVSSQSWGLNFGGFFQATFGWLGRLVGTFFSWLGGVFSGTTHV